jgi:hypothetical protein
VYASIPLDRATHARVRKLARYTSYSYSETLRRLVLEGLASIDAAVMAGALFSESFDDDG